jgi:opacity protein-like surface antigen
MNRSVFTLSILLSLSGFAAAQATPSAYRRPRSEINLQGGGVFARAVTEDGVHYKPTSAGSVDVGYRFYLTRWLGVEGDFDYFRNSQKYTTSTIVLSQKTNVAAVSGAAVFNLPNPLTKKFESFFMVGGGALIFHPENTDTSFETKQAIVFGGGIDVPLGRHLAIRGQAKTFLYKAPDFGVPALKVDKFTQAMIPSAGIVWKF